MKNDLIAIWHGVLIYLFYFCGRIICEVMFAFDWGCLYKYYNWFMCKSADCDVKCRLWKKEVTNNE